MLSRPLSTIESIFLHEGLFPRGFRIVAICEFDGLLDPARLQRAVDRACDQVPLLASVVRGGNGAMEFAVTDRPTVSLSSDRGAIERELQTPMSARENLARIALISDEGTGVSTLVVTVHHAIIDGAAMVALLDLLLREYSAGGENPTSTAASQLPPPLEERLPSASPAELAAYVNERSAMAEVGPLTLPAAGGPVGATPFAYRRFIGEPDLTQALRKETKRANSTVHGLLCAAALIALRRLLPDPQTPRAMTCQTPVNLRRRLSPPIGDQEIVSAAGNAYSLTTVSQSSDPMELACQVSQQVHCTINSGTVTREALALPRLLTVPPLNVSVGVTNMGTVNKLQTPPGLELRNLAVLPLAHAGPPIVVAATMSDRLTLDFPYSRRVYSDEQIRAFSEGTWEVLAGIGEAALRAEDRHEAAAPDPAM